MALLFGMLAGMGRNLSAWHPQLLELNMPAGMALGTWLDGWSIMEQITFNDRAYRVIEIESDGTITAELATSLHARSTVEGVEATERFPLYRLSEERLCA